MGKLKVTSWNIKHLHKLLPKDTDSAQQRQAGIAKTIQEIDPDILCVIEGPAHAVGIDQFSNNILNSEWVPVKEPTKDYKINGTQWIWFLVKPALVSQTSLQPASTWDTFSSASWPVHYIQKNRQTGERERISKKHRHYRHPQVLVLDWQGTRIEFIGLHLKSKFVRSAQSKWKKGGEDREEVVDGAVKARSKMTTEASNVREYIDAKFAQVENPGIFVLGDLNDGPGKEHFEREYLLHDLISNIQGDIFFARRFLNHALFDSADHLRWTAKFKDFIMPERPETILLDHILFTQGLVNGSLPLQVPSKAGWVEHEVFDVVNSTLPASAHVSDHRPISVVVETSG